MNPNLLRFLFLRLGERLWEKPQQIRCHERVLPDRRTSQISRESVEINGQRRRCERLLRMLRNQTSDHARENISRAARRHPRIPC